MPKSALAAVPNGAYRFIALDVETACGDAASICQIGLACVRMDGRIDTWATLIDPRCSFSRFNIELHGIGPNEVRGAPDFAEAMAPLEPILGRQMIIQHSSFDKRAISGAYAALGLEAPGWVWGDSVRIARRAWPEFIRNGGHGLGHLKTQLGLRFEHHDAGEDARAAAEVVLLAEARTGLSFEQLLGAR